MFHIDDRLQWARYFISGRGFTINVKERLRQACFPLAKFSYTFKATVPLSHNAGKGRRNPPCSTTPAPSLSTLPFPYPHLPFLSCTPLPLSLPPFPLHSPPCREAAPKAILFGRESLFLPTSPALCPPPVRGGSRRNIANVSCRT